MKQTRTSRAMVEVLESRTLLSGIAQVGGIGYLPSDNGTKFQRYDIANQKWLAPIALASSPGGATASLVDSDGIYVAYDRNVMRYKLDGTTPTHVINTTNAVNAIHSDGNLLFLNAGLFISINKTTDSLLDTFQPRDGFVGSSILPAGNELFGRSQGVSPPDIEYLTYDDTGKFLTSGDSGYNGQFGDASQTWTLPFQMVLDDSGVIYDPFGMTRSATLDSKVQDIAFIDGRLPVVLHDNTLTLYTETVLSAGSKALSLNATEILANSKNAIAFSPDATKANRFNTQIVAFSDFKPPQPGAPVNPVGLKYTPDHVETTANGTLLLLDIETRSIFRWDSSAQKYGATIPLANAPNFMAYSGATNTIYVAYDSGLINSIDLGAATPIEKLFAVLPSAAEGLATAGKYVFAKDNSGFGGGGGTHYTFAPDGTAISVVGSNHASIEYIWSAANSKMFFFREETSPRDLMWEVIGADGKIGAEIDSPLHSSEGFDEPIRVSPDGKIVILGSGVVHDATTLARLAGGLSNTVSDVAWLRGTVYTITGLRYAQFQQWTGSTFALGATSQVRGTPIALLSIADSKLVGIYTDAGGIPQFIEMNASMQTIPPTPPPPPPPSGDVIIQSETATLAGGTVRANSSSGFTGSGFAKYAGQNSSVTYTTTHTTAGTAKLTFRYANGSTVNRPLQIFVNNVAVGTIAMAPTGGWGTWWTASLDAVKLPAGTVSIKAVASTSAGGPYVDHLTIGSVGTTLEAETQQLSGGATNVNNTPGFTGKGYVKYATQGSAVTFSTVRASAGTGKLTFRYSNGLTVNRPLQIFVNGILAGTLAFAPTGAWTTWNTLSLNGVTLPAGVLTIKVVASTSASGPNLDSLTVA